MGRGQLVCINGTDGMMSLRTLSIKISLIKKRYCYDEDIDCYVDDNDMMT